MTHPSLQGTGTAAPLPPASISHWTHGTLAGQAWGEDFSVAETVPAGTDV